MRSKQNEAQHTAQRHEAGRNSGQAEGEGAARRKAFEAPRLRKEADLVGTTGGSVQWAGS